MGQDDVISEEPSASFSLSRFVFCFLSFASDATYIIWSKDESLFYDTVHKKGRKGPKTPDVNDGEW